MNYYHYPFDNIFVLWKQKSFGWIRILLDALLSGLLLWIRIGFHVDQDPVSLTNSEICESRSGPR
jgi:hypothetical protein